MNKIPIIVVEGSDGLGKSTLVESLYNTLHPHLLAMYGLELRTFREPTGAIRDIIKSGPSWEPATIDLLMAASHVQVLAHFDTLPENSVILMDRWTPISSYAYMLGMRDRPVDDYTSLSHFFVRTPDLILWLDAPYKVSRSRRPIHSQPVGLLEKWDNADEDAYEKTRQKYARIMSAIRSQVIKIDASSEVRTVEAYARSSIKSFIADFRSK